MNTEKQLTECQEKLRRMIITNVLLSIVGLAVSIGLTVYLYSTYGVSEESTPILLLLAALLQVVYTITLAIRLCKRGDE